MTVINPTRVPFVVMPPASGSAATDAAAFTAALSQLPGGKGTVFFQAGNYQDNQQRTLGNYVNIVGMGGINAGAGPGTLLSYTGTASPYMNCVNGVGQRFQDLMIFANQSGFTGRLLDLSSSSFVEVERCYLGAVDTTAAVLAYLDNAQICTFRKCNIVGGALGVQGIAVGGHFSTVISIESCRFGSSGTAGISGPGSGWLIANNDFELTGAIPAMVAGPSAALGVTITGNWMGDATGSPAAIQLFGNGISIVGNYLACSSTGTIIRFVGTCDGVSITGNRLDTGSVGIDRNGQTVTNIYIGENSFTNVTTAIAGTPFNSDSLLLGTGATDVIPLKGTSTTTAPGAGGAGALPATPAGYVTVPINGTNRQIAFY